MSSYVSGGKTWNLPSPSQSSSTNTSTSSSHKKVNPFFHYGYPVVMLTLGFLVALQVAMLIALMVSHQPALSDYSEQLTTTGGFKVDGPSFLSLYSFNVISYVVFAVIPIITAIILRRFHDKKMFSGSHGKRNRNIAIIATTLFFFAISAFNIIDRGEIEGNLSENALMDKMDIWMNDRYGFQPTIDVSPEDVENGRTLHPDSLSFPVQDVKMVKVGDGYFLHDMNGQELPVKNN